MLAYIRDELDLDKLSKQLSKLLDPEKDQMKYFAALFREGHYFNEDEIRDILDEYRGLMNAPVYLQKKWMGDLLTSSGRASRAIRYYQEALGQKEIKEELKTFEDSDFLLDAFEEQFAAFEEDFAYSAMAEKYRKIVFLDENGKPEEALAKKQRLVSALKKDFRKEIDI